MLKSKPENGNAPATAIAEAVQQKTQSQKDLQMHASTTPSALQHVATLRTHAIDASNLGMEALNLIGSLLYAIERLATDLDAVSSSHVIGLIRIAGKEIDDYHNTLDCIREEAAAIPVSGE